MRRAILTGFEPFGPYKYNPVQDAAKEYNGKKIGDIEVMGLVVPASYYGAFDLLSRKIDEFSPEIIISSGLSSRVPCIRLEAMGRNIMNGKYADAEGRKPNGEPIIEDGKPVYQSNADNILLASVLFERGIPAEVSVNAEGFACNSLLYLTARRIFDENLPISFAFFHTPWTEDYLDRIKLEPGKVTIKKSDLRRTIEILVKEIGQGTQIKS